MDHLLNKIIPVPVIKLRRFPDEETQQYTYINKIGQRELTPAAKKKIEFRLQNNIIPKVKD